MNFKLMQSTKYLQRTALHALGSDGWQ